MGTPYYAQPLAQSRIQSMDALLTAAASQGGGPATHTRSLVRRDHVDLSHITNNEDRQFVSECMDDLLALEPGNDLTVEFFDNGPLWYMTVQGMRNPIDDSTHQRFRSKRHPIIGHVGIVKTQTVMPKGPLDQVKFALHIAPSGHKLAHIEQQHRHHHLPPPSYPPAGAPPPQYLPISDARSFTDPGPPNYGGSGPMTATKGSHTRRARTRDASPQRSSSSSASSSSSDDEGSSSEEKTVLQAMTGWLPGMGRKKPAPKRRSPRGRKK